MSAAFSLRKACSIYSLLHRGASHRTRCIEVKATGSSGSQPLTIMRAKIAGRECPDHWPNCRTHCHFARYSIYCLSTHIKPVEFYILQSVLSFYSPTRDLEVGRFFASFQVESVRKYLIELFYDQCYLNII